MEVKPYDIIDAFDDCLKYVYGKKYARTYPAKFDKANAEEWIKKGLTVPVACFVFYHQMSRMHERWLRRSEKDRDEVPKGLSVFTENIIAGIARAKGDELDSVERADSQWRNRFTGWLNGQSWYENLWGAPPLTSDGSVSKNTRMPAYLVKELMPKTLRAEKLGKVIQATG